MISNIKKEITEAKKQITESKKQIAVIKREVAEEKKQKFKSFHLDIENTMREMKNRNCEFIYYCRSTCPREIEVDRPMEDKKIQAQIDELFAGNGYYFTHLVLDKKTTERMITNFKNKESKPYIQSKHIKAKAPIKKLRSTRQRNNKVR